MKKFILKTLFKKELSLIHNNYQRQVSLIEDEFETKINKLKKTYDIPKEIFSKYPQAEIIGIEKNKKNDEVFVFRAPIGRSFEIKLYVRRFNDNYQIPTLFATLRNNSHQETDYIWIGNITSPKENIGNGSITMKYLIKMAKEMKVSHISGRLSPEDRDHFDKLEHFYKKFGFEVKFNTDRTEGSIKKILDN
ncbi:hypothetical protein [Bacillus pseudomycoides]|uniref:hypothetical protein n=4 Tax=Bacillus pseudomycoides TaxID=64104 RepID=UPI000BF75BB0|nr:hypothetical protein [Bacillus pseudomycoides]PFZ06003.1 hypothetical protein COL60_22260 [Bacillus pseudomycoides]PGA56752.1 hypothetical protein COL84_27380 [Bacillus pseudomycoides]PGE94671.1 hypothetical protein COM62_22855 [Bacillus pseudomycoides]